MFYISYRGLTQLGLITILLTISYKRIPYFWMWSKVLIIDELTSGSTKIPLWIVMVKKLFYYWHRYSPLLYQSILLFCPLAFIYKIDALYVSILKHIGFFECADATIF